MNIDEFIKTFFFFDSVENVDRTLKGLSLAIDR